MTVPTAVTVTNLKIQTHGGGIAVEITAERQPANLYFEDRANVADLPPDVKEALLDWLAPERGELLIPRVTGGAQF